MPPRLAHGRRGPLRDHPQAVAREDGRPAGEHRQQEAEVARVGAQGAVEQDHAEERPEEPLDRVVPEAERAQVGLGRSARRPSSASSTLRRAHRDLGGQPGQAGGVARPAGRRSAAPRADAPKRWPRLPVEHRRPGRTGAGRAADADGGEERRVSRVGAEEHLEAAVHRPALGATPCAPGPRPRRPPRARGPSARPGQRGAHASPARPPPTTTQSARRRWASAGTAAIVSARPEPNSSGPPVHREGGPGHRARLGRAQEPDHRADLLRTHPARGGRRPACAARLAGVSMTLGSMQLTHTPASFTSSDAACTSGDHGRLAAPRTPPAPRTGAPPRGSTRPRPARRRAAAMPGRKLRSTTAGRAHVQLDLPAATPPGRARGERIAVPVPADQVGERPRPAAAPSSAPARRPRSGPSRPPAAGPPPRPNASARRPARAPPATSRPPGGAGVEHARVTPAPQRPGPAGHDHRAASLGHCALPHDDAGPAALRCARRPVSRTSIPAATYSPASLRSEYHRR